MGNLANDTLENIWNNSEKNQVAPRFKDERHGWRRGATRLPFVLRAWCVMPTKALQEIRLKSTVISALLLQRISRLSLTGERRN